MTPPPRRPAACVTFTLHAHLPYVVNHGTWPHGMEWLHEAAAETYLPLLGMLRRLESDGIRFNCNLVLSPILLEQLVHPVFLQEFPRYLSRKIVAAEEDEAFFQQSGEAHYASLAHRWKVFFTEALDEFNALDRSLVDAFRHFEEVGLISIVTSCATHSYLPLLGTDESVRAQIRTAVQTHKRHLGREPRGLWSPECGYRPAGLWVAPVADADGAHQPSAFERIGVEQAVSESGLEFFVVDTHLIEGGRRVLASASFGPGRLPSTPAEAELTENPGRRLYQPYFVDGPYDKRFAATVFPRDPRTGVQVWSSEGGYPGEPAYLDFHKKRWPGGHRYWRVTDWHSDMAHKEPYYPDAAAERIHAHAAHFAHLLWQTLSPSFNRDLPPILCAPFDAELFGHWWFEGMQWLEAVARNLHDYDTGIDLISCAEYLDRYPRAGVIAMSEGSWGIEGNNRVWLNAETSWTWSYIYPAERFVRDLATAGAWRDSPLATRLARQLCRELLLLESSDWQFLITTGAARDYAEARFQTHLEQFNDIRALWQTHSEAGSLSAADELRLAAIETRDNVFPDIDPAFWAAGAHATPPAPHSV